MVTNLFFFSVSLFCKAFLVPLIEEGYPDAVTIDLKFSMQGDFNEEYNDLHSPASIRLIDIFKSFVN